MSARLRQLWLSAHRWLALSVGWLLAAVGLMGALLVVAQPLDRALHPELFKARAPSAAPSTSTHRSLSTSSDNSASPAAPLEPVRQRLAAEFGKKASFKFRPPRAPGDSLWVFVRADWSGVVYFDPATGQEQGRRGDGEGILNTLFKLHSSLGLQETGKAVLAWIALAYLALLSSGLVLWWPRRWPASWRLEFGKGTLRALFDVHRVGGAALGLLIAVSVASGAYMAWRPLGGLVTTLSGREAVKPPRVPAAPGPAVPLDALLARAQQAFPNQPAGYIQVPGQAGRPVQVRLRLSDDPHPNGLTSVWLHPTTGEVLATQRWDELDPGARAVAVVYPLHTGALGGPPLEALIFLSGLALGVLGISGIWLWWRRRAARRAASLAGRAAA